MSTIAKPISSTLSDTGIPTARLITWWVIASEVMIFGGLIMIYVINRLGHLEWTASAAHTSTWSGAFNTFVLLTSSLFAVLAGQAADAQDGSRATKFLHFTVLSGLVFLIVKGFEWTTEVHEGFVLSSGGFWSYYYILTGLHGLHVLAGMMIMLIIAVDAVKNRELQRVECIGLYWHFVDIVWILLFPLLYIAK